MAARQLRYFGAVNFRRIALQHHRHFRTFKNSSNLLNVWKYRIGAFSAGLLSSVAVTEVFGSIWLRPSQLCLAASQDDEGEKSEEVVPKQMSRREKRFNQFASCEFEGQVLMTAQDFLESLTENEPKCKLSFCWADLTRSS